LSQAYGLRIVAGHAQLKERIIMIAKFDPNKIKYSLVAIAVMAVLTSVTLTKPRANTLAQAQPFGASGSSGSEASHGTAPAANEPLSAAASNPSKIDTPAERRAAVKASAKGGIPMEVLIEQVATNIHKRINVDPSAHSTVMLYGQKIAEIDYADLLTILKINGFTAYEMNNYINIVPIREARELPVPIAVEGEAYPDDQFVSMTLTLKNACAAQLLPIVRPLLPQYAFVAASVASNTLWFKDTFANLKGIESMVKEVDAHSKPNGQCASLGITQGTAGPTAAK
jgi:hypothetical protein